jgi:Mrp family chromosome partitioning ATPase
MLPYASIARGIIAVTSCKGGVGKSTLSLELAHRLANRGHRVGLFDADLHGPSLPAQAPQALERTQRGRVEVSVDGRSVVPLSDEGIKLMSFGWLSRLWVNFRAGDQSAKEIRIVPRLATQLLHTTQWGDLDYLIVDSPPGTGAIPVAIAKTVPLAGAVVVTTPSQLAVVDVIRGVKMLQRLCAHATHPPRLIP